MPGTRWPLSEPARSTSSSNRIAQHLRSDVPFWLVSDKPRILVADDSETIRTLLVTALRSGGYEIETADDGVEAYEMGKTGDFDLVILDQLMPGLLGLEVIERWRDENIDVPVLMLTGVDDDRTAVESFDRGAVDYVRKPFRVTELMARIRQRV